MLRISRFSFSALLLISLLSVLSVAPRAYAQAGLYTGSWTNTTFGSTGAADAEVIISPPNVSFMLDLDGFVFGESDPTPLTLSGLLNPDGTVSFTPVMGHPTYGDVTGSVTAAGVITATGANVPSPNIDHVSLSGQLSPGAIDINYAVHFEAAGVPPALGFIDLNLIPEPVSASLLLLAPLMLRRRRA